MGSASGVGRLEIRIHLTSADFRDRVLLVIVLNKMNNVQIDSEQSRFARGSCREHQRGASLTVVTGTVVQ